MTADIHTLAGAYALDALPEEERLVFEEHLEVCQGCRQEVAELEATASQLGIATALTPPTRLKEQVLAEIRTTRQVRPPTVFQPQIATWRRFLVPLAAALAVVVLGLGLALAQLNQQVTSFQADAEQTRQLLTAPDLRVIPLDAPTGVSASFAYSSQLERGLFVAEGLAGITEDQAYELWLISGDQAVPAGLLRPGDNGDASHLVSGDLGRSDSFGVTIEPAGGSETPTGDILIFGEL